MPAGLSSERPASLPNRAGARHPVLLPATGPAGRRMPFVRTARSREAPARSPILLPLVARTPLRHRGSPSHGPRRPMRRLPARAAIPAPLAAHALARNPAPARR